jgi:hypothetical protein
MTEYHKIQSVFKRDMEAPKHPFLIGQYSSPEIEYLANNKWEWTEKVDGTNIRVIWDAHALSFGGKTDNAQMPGKLVDVLRSMFTVEKMEAQFKMDDPSIPPPMVVLYGEGYGPKIQKVGSLYRADQSFVLFDVRIGRWWMKGEDVRKIAAGLGIDAVPVIGEGTIAEAIEIVKAGFKSRWGDFNAEGMVLRPKVDMFARSGERIITKLKTRDFAC